MNTHTPKSEENKPRSVANSVAQKKSNVKQGFGFVDNRPEAVAQRKLEASALNSQLFSNKPTVQRLIDGKGEGELDHFVKMKFYKELTTEQESLFKAYLRRLGSTEDYDEPGKVNQGLNNNWSLESFLKNIDLIIENPRYIEAPKEIVKEELKVEEKEISKKTAPVVKKLKVSPSEFTELIKNQDLFLGEKYSQLKHILDQKFDFSEISNAQERIYAVWKDYNKILEVEEQREESTTGEKIKKSEQTHLTKGDFFLTNVSQSAGTHKNADDGIIQNFENAVNTGKMRWNEFQGGTHNNVSDPTGSVSAFKAHQDGKGIKLYIDPSQGGGSKWRANYALVGTALKFSSFSNH